MKTEDLIAALSQDTQKRAGPMQALGGAMLPALAVSMVFYFAALNFRRDLLGSLTILRSWGNSCFRRSSSR